MTEQSAIYFQLSVKVTATRLISKEEQNYTIAQFRAKWSSDSGQQKGTVIARTTLLLYVPYNHHTIQAAKT